jgi:hypothetical protein
MRDLATAGTEGLWLALEETVNEIVKRQVRSCAAASAGSPRPFLPGASRQSQRGSQVQSAGALSTRAGAAPPASRPALLPPRAPPPQPSPAAARPPVAAAQGSVVFADAGSAYFKSRNAALEAFKCAEGGAGAGTVAGAGAWGKERGSCGRQCVRSAASAEPVGWVLV